MNYRPGRMSQNTDALSRHSLPAHSHTDEMFGILTHLSPEVSPKGGDTTLSDQQRSDPELQEIITLLTDSSLPDDNKHAKELALTRSQFVMLDDVLYYLAKDKSLLVIPLASSQEKLFLDVHSGPYGAHLRERKFRVN